MKITLKELRSIIRESVRQYLNESDSESSLIEKMSNEKLVEAAIAAQIGNDEDKYVKLKTEIENRINELKKKYDVLPPGDEGLAGRGILPARIGNLQRGLMSPDDRNKYDSEMGGIKMAGKLGFGPATDWFDPGGKRRSGGGS